MVFTEAAVLRLLAGLYSLQETPDGAAEQAMVDALARALDCDLLVHLAIDRPRGRGALHAWPAGSLPPVIDRATIEWHEREHPLVARLSLDRSIRAWRLSDADPHGAFYRTRLYREIHQPLRARYQMVMRLASPDHKLLAIVACRGGNDFDDHEQRLLELSWMHLARHARQVRRSRWTAHGGVSIERPREQHGVVVLDDALAVELCSEQARLWLAEYFPGHRPRYRPTLPSAVLAWARSRVDAEGTGLRNPVTHGEPLVVTAGDRCLVIDLIVDHGKGRHVLTLAQERLFAPAASLEAFGLTPREAEVLAWIAQGKTNREIGMILGASGRTVQKHAEHIFQKLGVESRMAATLCAWQAGRLEALAQR